MSILKTAAALFLLSASCMQAWAWDYKGHEVTGSVADQLLEPNARRASGDFGIGNQIAIMFDGHGVTPVNLEGTVAGGTVKPCK